MVLDKREHQRNLDIPPPFHITCRFDFCKYIRFVMYSDINIYLFMHSKRNV
jgi:hypothetical protein